MLHVIICVKGRGGDAQSFLAARHSLVIDRLEIDTVLCKQQFARAPALMCLTDDQRQNMTWRVEQGHAGRLEHRLQPLDIAFLPRPSLRMSSDVLYSREGTRSKMRAKRGCEDEAVREAADDVNQQRGPGDIAAHHPKGLGERSLDERHTMRHTVALRDATAAHAVETDGVDLVEIGDRAVLFGDI